MITCPSNSKKFPTAFCVLNGNLLAIFIPNMLAIAINACGFAGYYAGCSVVCIDF